VTADPAWTVLANGRPTTDGEGHLEIEAARTADGSAEAELGAARALAARPTVAAKEAAWHAMTDDQVSNRMFSALADGLWSAEHADLVAPYVAAYAERGPALAARSSAFANVVGWGFPCLALDAEQVATFERALRGDVPTPLRRAWKDELDDRSECPSRTDPETIGVPAES
jgi:aminopeptidase N